MGFNTHRKYLRFIRDGEGGGEDGRMDTYVLTITKTIKQWDERDVTKLMFQQLSGESNEDSFRKHNTVKNYSRSNETIQF